MVLNPDSLSGTAVENDPILLNQKAIDAFQAGDLEAALGFIAAACACPDALPIHRLNHAEILRRCGKGEAAEAEARIAIAGNPGFAASWEILGTILFERRTLGESATAFENAIKIDPNGLNAWNNLAVVRQCLGERRAAERCYRAVLRLAPGNIEIKLNFAVLLGELGRHGEAIEIVEGVLAHAPETLKAYIVASEIELNSNRPKAALLRIEQAFQLADHRLKPLVQRGRIFCHLGRYAEALRDFEQMLADVPDFVEALHGRALALQGLSRPEEAFAAFVIAEAASTTPASIIADRAWMLAELGRKKDALALLEQALSLAPNLAAAWFYKAYLTKYSPGHPDLAAMERIADDPDAVCADRTRLGFALGKAYLDMEDGPRAFARLDQANRFKRQTLRYSLEDDAKRFAEIATIFSYPLAPRLAAGETASLQPIFVFGMSRSGTTLVEQILASHPMAHGVGEPTLLRDLADELGFPARVTELSPDDLSSIGERYLDRFKMEAGDAAYIVDKMPSNFIYAGLIPLILPGAKMIHCRRDPLDTCLSNYALLFAIDHEYAYDQRELGQYYGLYLKLIDHWRRILPPETLLEIDYEAMVDDTEAQVRKILQFCGLPWDSACLRFHETARRVSSASLDQVRSPVYSKSVGRARAFLEWLGPLTATLKDAT